MKKFYKREVYSKVAKIVSVFILKQIVQPQCTVLHLEISVDTAALFMWLNTDFIAPNIQRQLKKSLKIQQAGAGRVRSAQ